MDASRLDINAKNSNGAIALMRAVVLGDEVMVSLLLKVGADPKVIDDSGHTASRGNFSILGLYYLVRHHHAAAHLCWS